MYAEDTEDLSFEERLQEIAAILARGILVVRPS
jgi:hypothetical protein